MDPRVAWLCDLRDAEPSLESEWRVGDMADLPQRRTIRMRGYDYASEGAYFVTICTDDMRHLFGRVENGVMITNALGDIAQQCWDAIPQHMPHVDIGAFVVMPNHVHGIIIIREHARARHDAPGIATALPPTGRSDGPADPPETLTPNQDNNDLPEPGMPGGDNALAGAHGTHARARHDAPLRPTRKPPGIPRGALGQIVASYKSAVTRIAYRDGVLPRGATLWQRNYWDDIIRGDGSYERITEYIRNNPANWRKDDFHG